MSVLNDSAYRMASAIVRLVYLREKGRPRLAVREGKAVIEMEFFQPLACKCCGKPLISSDWLRSVVGVYGPEIQQLLASP